MEMLVNSRYLYFGANRRILRFRFSVFLSAHAFSCEKLFFRNVFIIVPLSESYRVKGGAKYKLWDGYLSTHLGVCRNRKSSFKLMLKSWDS